MSMEITKGKYSQKKIDDLMSAVLRISDMREARAFFRDLCTLDELKSLAERWEIARLLYQGLSYRKTAEKLKVSTTTVSRVALWLYSGKGGYLSVLKKYENNYHHHPSLSRRKS